VRADSLSRATQDQIYLAARMSLLELVCEGRRPPLLLDDPFVNYDDSRVENTIRLLRELYGEHQIVLFTCTGRYDRHADTVIALNGPRMVAEASATVAAS
jgi:exonuclease SbcC